MDANRKCDACTDSLIKVAVLLLITRIVHCQTGCESGWISWDEGWCYYLSQEEARTYSSAAGWCEEEAGGRLARLDMSDPGTARALRPHLEINSHYWIQYKVPKAGISAVMSTNETSSNVTDIDAQPKNHTRVIETNNATHRASSCGAINGIGLYETHDCLHYFSFICEKANQQTTPTYPDDEKTPEEKNYIIIGNLRLATLLVIVFGGLIALVMIIDVCVFCVAVCKRNGKRRMEIRIPVRRKSLKSSLILMKAFTSTTPFNFRRKSSNIIL